MDKELNTELTFLSKLTKASSRRSFLKWGGIGISVVAATSMIGCGGSSNDSDSSDTSFTFDGNGGTFGQGDVAILNYAYALEQLEAAFYTKVVSSYYSGVTSEERSILSDIQKHEVIHRDFLKTALGSAAIPDLSVTFETIDFTSRQSVLSAARSFEDLGVSAYNGAGQLIKSADYLLLAGKIVSVEARHAAAIRDLLSPHSSAFAGDDVVDSSNGLDGARRPTYVVSEAGVFITTPINTGNLP